MPCGRWIVGSIQVIRQLGPGSNRASVEAHEEVKPMSLTVQTPTWPDTNFSRAPYEVFTEPDFYRSAIDRIFRGPVGHYLALDIELPSYGDYRTTWLGAINVVVVRAKDGGVHAFENTCAHRGARIVDQLH